MSIILGIDPGNTRSAAVILRDGRIADKCRLPNKEFLQWLHVQKMEHSPNVPSLRLHDPLRVVCEMPAMLGKGIGIFWQVLETCCTVGRVQAVFSDLERVTRGSVKIAVCGKSSTNDSAVRAKLIQIYGEPGTSKRPGPTHGLHGDMWAALAVAHAASKGCKLYDPALLKQRTKKPEPST